MILVEEEEPPRSAWSTALVAFFALLWIFAGIAAFVVSLMCFGRTGSDTSKIFGFLLAVFFGPFYWIYFAVSKKYCRNLRKSARLL